MHKMSERKRIRETGGRKKGQGGTIRKKRKKVKKNKVKIPKNPCDYASPAGANDIAETEAERVDIVNNKPVRGAIGRLLYLARLTRMDILFATVVLARYQSKPSVAHWNAIQRILLYLAGTLDKGLMFYPKTMIPDSPNIMCMSDASNGVYVDGYDSTAGYVIYFLGTVLLSPSLSN